MKVLIIGGVAGGATFLGRFRRLNEKARIIMFEKEGYVSFANCALPYYIGGEIEKRYKLFVSNKEMIEKRYNAEIRVFCEVVKIDRKNKKVIYLNKLENKYYEETYDKLVISTGSSPKEYYIKSDVNNMFNLITIDDTDKIYEFIQKNNPKTALVIGGGFIGIEICENLVKKGLDVTLAVKDMPMSKVDYDMSKLVLNTLYENNVNVIFNKKFKKLSNLSLTDDDIEIKSDIIISAIGVKANNSLFEEDDISENGTIKTNNDYSLLTDKDIFSIGDIVEEENYINSKKEFVPLANLANKMARYASDNISFNKTLKKKPVKVSIIKIFDKTLAYCGLSEKDLIKDNKVYKKDYFYTIIHPYSHATYYKNSKQMTMKIIFDDKRVLGAQIYGSDGVDKRIDSICVAMQFNASVNDLVDLELSYAPPYNQAKDPINFAGYVAQNILNNLTDQISVKEYLENKEKFTLIDLRDESEYKDNNFIKEAEIFIPLNKLRENISKLDKSKNYLVYCHVGIRGYIGERILKQNGFKVSNLMGGYLSYINYVK